MDKVRKKAVVICFKAVSNFLDGLKKITKVLSQDSQTLGLNWSPEPPEY
jgi:hypothetical protein